MDQQDDREEDSDVALEPGEVGEDEAKQGRNDQVFEDSVGDTAANEPSKARDKVFTSFSVEEVNIDSCQPVGLKKEEEVRVSGSKQVKGRLSRTYPCQIVGNFVKHETTDEAHENRLRPRTHQSKGVSNGREQCS